ncbi:hypothetical protein Agub_g14465, partial [Astrephomene gubernaculifera]
MLSLWKSSLTLGERSLKGVPLSRTVSGGFLKRCCMHNIFNTWHLTDRHRCGPASSLPLFACQIDFEKAFDRVPRDLLWLRLKERGVQGGMLYALKACCLYAHCLAELFPACTLADRTAV